MLRFTTLRFVQIAFLMLAMSFVFYALIGLMPGDPIDLMISANPNLTPADAARLKALHGLDQPIWLRYYAWLSAALDGDFGYSRGFNQPVLDIMGPHLARTCVLMGLSFVLSVAIAVAIGTAAAARPNSAFDYIVNFLSFAGRAVPPFWLALVLILVFAVALRWLPAGGMETVGDSGFWDRLKHLVLPVVCLTLLNISTIARIARAETLAALRQDYIRTARAKGLSRRRVLWGHAFRNAANPLVTVIALDFGALFSGALITETIFSYPGMGKLIFDSVMSNDYNTALAGLLFATVITLLANYVADVLYAVLDPRVSYR
ncbi:MAG: ABC transporter permease [Alphaproteobacteria bacterium]